MATISGALLFDSARTGISSPSMPGIAGVPIVLQNTATNVMLAVTTDANGRYTFLNVPNGEYRIVEAYGTAAGSSPGDFSQAQTASPAVSALPPISFAPSAPAQANQLDAVTSSTLNVTITGSDITGRDILNGPIQVPADVAIAKTADVETIFVGERVTYTLAITNHGPGLARNITLTDQLPSTLQNAEYSTDGGTVWNPWTGEFSLAELAASATFNVLLRSTVALSATGTISNTATVSAATEDPNTSNNTSTDQLPVFAVANMGITKQADRTSVRPGDTLIYTIVVSNSGPSEARGVVVTDDILLTLTNPEYSIDNGASWQPWVRTLTIGTMASGTSVTILIRCVVSPTASRAIGNLASVNSRTPDPVSGNRRSYVEVPVVTSSDPSADLSVSKEAGSASVRPGDTLTYTLTVSNHGPDAASTVILSDNVPSVLTGSQYSINNGASWQTWSGSLALGTMANGSSSTTLLRGIVASSATGSISNTASVSSSTTDPNTANNSTSLQTSVVIPPDPTADLSVSKQSGSASVRPGDTLTYTLTVSNHGPDSASTVILSDNVPSVLTGPQYSINNGASWQTWNGSLALGTMANGASSTTLLRGIVASSATGSISNTASVSSSTTDPNTANNSASLQTSLVIPPDPTADLSVSKQSGSASVRPGDTLTYTLTVSNHGPDAAGTVILSDNVPSVLTGPQYSINNGASWQTWNGSLALGTMANGASSTTLLRGIVASSAAGSISNTASVSSSTTDPNTANNSASLQTSVVIPPEPTADLAVSKQSGSASVRPGDTLTYTLTVSNHGPDSASTVILSDNVPSVLTGLQYSINNGASWQTWNGSLALGTMANGASSTTLLRGVVAASATGSISNTASVSSSTTDPNTANNSASLQTSVVIPPEPTADLAVSKEAGSASVRPGDTLTYTLTVSNHGPDAASTVILSDNVPSVLTSPQYSTNNGTSWQTWNGSLALGTMANGSSSTTLLRGVVAASATGSISNTASVSSSTTDPNTANNSASLQTSVVIPPDPTADLAVSKQAGSASVRPGDTLTYTLTVSNNGPDAASTVILSDNVPSVLTGPQYSINNGASWQTWNGSLALGTMANGASSTTLLRGTVAASATGSISNTASVSSSTTDPNTANNSASLQTPVVLPPDPTADLAVSKEAGSASVRPGDTLTYTLTVSNNGPDAASTVMLSDNVPSVLTGPQYSINNGASWQTWNGSLVLGTMANGASSTTLLRGIVAASATGSISNTASVSSSTTDPNTANNSASLRTSVESPPSPEYRLILTKRIYPCPVTPRSCMTVTIGIANPGTAEATNILLSSFIPEEICHVDYSLDQGISWQPWTEQLTLDNIPASEIRTIILRGIIDRCALHSLTILTKLSYRIAAQGPFTEQVSSCVPIRQRKQMRL